MNEERENKEVGLNPVQEFPPCFAYSTRMTARSITASYLTALAAASLLLAGCHKTGISTPAPSLSPAEAAAQANALFLNQKTFDPWVLTAQGHDFLPVYFSDGKEGMLYSSDGTPTQWMKAGVYENGQLKSEVQRPQGNGPGTHTLNFQNGTYNLLSGGKLTNIYQLKKNWQSIWQTSDVVISGDPEAQQVTHANLFYLLSSTYPGSDHSIPPMGLSSDIYGGHIFWDAEVWMMPALLVQHPEYAKSVVDYRFKTLGQAKRNAAAHGFHGAEYPWESADTGKEMAPAGFDRERHITADVGWAAWQFYLWTGDKAYLTKEGGPILTACADYWVSRVTKGTDGKYHINGVIGPDETADVVNDDAYTNGVVRACLDAAGRAAKAQGQTPDPHWATVAANLVISMDPTRQIPSGSAAPLTDRFSAKQADTLLLLYPLNAPGLDAPTAGKMLDFYSAHTIKNGPAMTASMEAIVAARLGRSQQSLDLFHDSYRPFMRGPWDAFAEKRTSNRVYFCTGMGGCLQSVLFGFAGLRLVEAGQAGQGTKIAGDSEAALYADPHLPPGWTGLTVKGVRFRGKSYDVAVGAANKVTVTVVP